MKYYHLVLILVIIISLVIGVATFFIIEEVVKYKKRNKIVICNKTRWGCCRDGFTPKLDPLGSNCLES